MSEKQRVNQEEEMVAFNIPTHDEKGVEYTKSARKKLLTKAKKEAQANKRKEANKQNDNVKRGGAGEGEGQEAGNNFGLLPVITSASRENKVFTKIRDLSAKNDAQEVFLRARVHTLRAKGNLCFLVLRQRESTIQAVVAKSGVISKQMLTFISGVSLESVVDITGTITIPKDPVVSTTQSDVEIQVTKFFVMNMAQGPLPVQLEDCERPLPLIKEQKTISKAIDAKIEVTKNKIKESGETPDLLHELEALEKEKGSAQKFVVLPRRLKLDNRVIDLRTTANQCIFKIQSGICQLFREYLYQNDFTEIHTPKLIGTASEGGASVFKLEYFEMGNAYLAQSPQLYKQMVISGDMDRVFEIAPVFRAEKAFTPRHMTEFIGLDMEMAFNEHYHEVLDVLDGLFIYIFDNIPKRYAKEIQIIKKQYPFEDFKYSTPSLRLTWPEAVKLLNDNGTAIGDFDDISTVQEKELGRLVKEKYGTDFYMLDKFPLCVRPFYTMPDPTDERYSNSYDFFIRGQEILSGAQRIHVPELLMERAKHHEVDLTKIKDYVDSFRYGAFPHGGGGIGLERVVMLYLGLTNIMSTTLFPRTPTRLNP